MIAMLSIINWFTMLKKRCEIAPPNSPAIPLPTRLNSAAGRHAKTIYKLLILRTSQALTERFWAPKGVCPCSQREISFDLQMAEEAGVEPTEDAFAPSDGFEDRASHRARCSSGTRSSRTRRCRATGSERLPGGGLPPFCRDIPESGWSDYARRPSDP